MDTENVIVELPADLYSKLAELAFESQSEPVDIIARLVAQAYQRRAWLYDLAALRQQIERDGGLPISTDKDEAIERLRQTRREIFEAEYAHLYR